MTAALLKVDPHTVDDIKWRFREHLYEELARMMRHGMFAQQYLEDGTDWLASFHINEARRCMKFAITTHNELVGVGENGGAHE